MNVIPVKAGIWKFAAMVPRFRGNDGRAGNENG
jgi:hypothetical protein